MEYVIIYTGHKTFQHTLCYNYTVMRSHEKINGHRELTVTMVVTAPGPNDHGSVTARRGHSSVTARSQLSHGEVTAQSQRLPTQQNNVRRTLGER